jgi:hypothetical protein
MSNVVIAKLAGMRKIREWIVMPTSDDPIIVQTDGAIGIFDWRSGNGRLSTKGGYFPHLASRSRLYFPSSSVALACAHAQVLAVSILNAMARSSSNTLRRSSKSLSSDRYVFAFRAFSLSNFGFKS